MTQFAHIFDSWKKNAVLASVAFYVAINVFHIGSDIFIITLNNFTSVPLALGATLLSWQIGVRVKSAKQQQTLWVGLAIGWTMWAVAELWWAIASLIGQEVPYPSWADFFWLVGYLPVYFALWKRLRSLPQAEKPAQRNAVWVASAVLLGAIFFFVLQPTLAESDPSAILESAINLFYPLADTILLILVIRLMFTYQQGRYGIAWRWIAFGFLMSSWGDLFFAYANTIDMYYPEQQVNFLSAVVADVPYNLSYLAWVVGLLRLQSLLRKHQPVGRENKALKLVPNTHLLVFTKGDETVINVSRNYPQVYPADGVKGKTISEALGLSLEDEGFILRQIREKGIMEEKSFQANTGLGQKEIFISGIVVLDPQKGYSGATLLARLGVEDYALNGMSTDEQKEMARFLLKKTGAGAKEQAEIKQLLMDFYQAHFAAFYNQSFLEGGSIFADAFMAELQSAAKSKGWQINIQVNALDVTALPLSQAQQALSTLFTTGRRFLVGLIGETNVKALVEEVRADFGKPALENVLYFEEKAKERV